MSIILRANELNSILYKYLIESGLTHTAFALFNQAGLSQPLQQFRFDIRPGHLLSILEKGLVYAQIQAHVSLSEYFQCNQPFHLLKSHTCNVVERVKKQKELFLNELGDQISDSIKRTNSTYNTAVANRDYDQIVYDAKGAKYFQKFVKIRLPANEIDKSQSFIVKGSDQAPLLHNIQDFQIDLLRYDGLNDQVVIDQIFPCINDGKLESPVDFISTGDYLVQLYSNNKLTVFSLRNDTLEPIQFNLLSEEQGIRLLPNLAFQQLLTIAGKKQFWILNLTTLKLLKHQPGFFSWKDYDEYFVVKQNTVKIQSLNGGQLQTFSTQYEWSEISLNYSKNLYSLISYKQKMIHISTFENNQPLFIFDLKDESNIKQTLWINSNNVDYFCWLTDNQVKIFDISLNSYSKIIDISQYDTQISKISTLKKTDRDECFLIALGLENMLIYDVTNAKIERIEICSKQSQLFSLSAQKLALVMQNCIYFLVGQYIQPLFK